MSRITSFKKKTDHILKVLETAKNRGGMHEEPATHDFVIAASTKRTTPSLFDRGVFNEIKSISTSD
jgi:hypothetical protein